MVQLDAALDSANGSTESRSQLAQAGCDYRKLHPAVSRQMSHCYFSIAFLTQAPVPFLHVADFKDVRRGWDLRDTQMCATMLGFISVLLFLCVRPVFSHTERMKMR